MDNEKHYVIFYKSIDFKMYAKVHGEEALNHELREAARNDIPVSGVFELGKKVELETYTETKTYYRIKETK